MLVALMEKRNLLLLLVNFFSIYSFTLPFFYLHFNPLMHDLPKWSDTL